MANPTQLSLPESFWAAEGRRLAVVIVPRLIQMALEGARRGSEKIGIGFVYGIYNLLAEQWAREYTDALLKQVRTTNEAVVGDILARWISTPGSTFGDLHAALQPYFGVKRASVIAVTEATRAMASGELLAYQRAGIERIQWGTNKDELVCPFCGVINREVRTIGEPFGYFKWRKGQQPEPVYAPPYHPNCRCGISPVLASVSVRKTVLILTDAAIVARTLHTLPPLLAKHDGPGPHDNGSPQEVHGGDEDAGPTEKTGVAAIDNAYDFVRDRRNTELPMAIENGIDGGPAQSILYHGTTTRGLESLTSEHGDVYITPQPDEAAGYAMDMHRFGSKAKPGEVLIVRRRAGKTLNLTEAISDGFENGYEPDEVIAGVRQAAKDRGFRYLYFSHPSFADNEEQHAIISLFPEEDLRVLKRQRVKKLAKHDGPGPHPSGSPQSVHGGPLYQPESDAISFSAEDSDIYDFVVSQLEDGGWEGKRAGIAQDAIEQVSEYGQGLMVEDNGEAVAVGAFAIEETELIGKKEIPKALKNDASVVVISFLATKRKGYGREAMQNVVDYAAGEGLGIWLHSVPEAFGYYEAIGMKRHNPYGRDDATYFYWTADEVKKMARLQKAADRPAGGVPDADEPEGGLVIVPAGYVMKQGLAKGDFEGHPFRGNQWTGGQAPIPYLGDANDDRRIPTVAESPVQHIVQEQLKTLPENHMDGIGDITFTEGGFVGGDAFGDYHPLTKRIRLASNADNIAVLGGGTAIHEVGHHVHISRMTAEGADEWQLISGNGQNARISAYARTNRGEHFAEAYRAYMRGGDYRKKLKVLEPASYKYMASVSRGKWLLPEGESASTDNWRGRYED